MFQRQHEKMEKIISEHDAKRNQNVLKDHKVLPGFPHLANNSRETAYARGFPWAFSAFPPVGSLSPLSPFLCLKSTVPPLISQQDRLGSALWESM